MSEIASAPPDAHLQPEAITARSGSNFLAGFACLDTERRQAMVTIYAFCRVVDDAVDDAPDVAIGHERLRFWRGELAAAGNGVPQTPVGRALQAAMRRFGIPSQPLADLIDGCAMDLEPDGLADEAALHLYCARVASAVGFACLRIFGATGPGAERYAAALGQALQLTNILRDLRSDAEVGRTYVPRSWLDELAVDATWLLGTAPDEIYRQGGAVARLCERLAARARDQFAIARAELRRLPRLERRALVPARIMGAVYGDLLRRLERRGSQLLMPRVRVPRPAKLWLAATVWLGLRT